ncbi:MAG TPA: leucyl aminopeptidase family protein [Planctomycetota bacterium]|nr:leucyl aminopeptidase family protein [Planctomycetota bacterium]
MKFSFAADARTLAAADHLLVVAPSTCFGPRARTAALTKLLGEANATLALQLGREATPGLLGGLATSRTAAGKRLSTAVLADATSRHATASRAEAIRKVVAAANLSPAGRHAVLLVLDDAAHTTAAVNAVGRALPTFTQKSNAKSGGSLAIVCTRPNGSVLPIDATTRDVVERARTAAHLVDTPPTELDPTAFAAAARRLLKPLRGVTVREIVGDALLRQRLGGMHAVGRCARSQPRLVVASAGTRGPRVALVGKGVTYDTGGLHLKARGNMETMKSDMGGASAVLGAFAVLARQRLPCRLSLLLCLAENAIGPAAYKPDDILTMHSGKTVEINNTDAEGRLLLADGCSYAARVLGADVVIDAATLTGAQGVATGDLHAAVVSNDEALEQVLLAAGRSSGDLCWPLPFAPEFYRSEFHSPIADMRNSVKNRSNAQASCAAEFVHWHLDGTRARWAHIDLASPAFRGDRATGFGVALLVDAVRRLGA